MLQPMERQQSQKHKAVEFLPIHQMLDLQEMKHLAIKQMTELLTVIQLPSILKYLKKILVLTGLIIFLVQKDMLTQKKMTKDIFTLREHF